MTVDVQIPPLGESVSEGVIVRWIKSDGDRVSADEPLFELETDKASVEIPAPSAGVLAVLAKEGQAVRAGEVVARIDPNGASAKADGAKTARPASTPSSTAAAPASVKPAVAPEPRPPAAATAPPTRESAPASATSAAPGAAAATELSPAVRRLVEEHALDPRRIAGTGKGGRLTKADVLEHVGARQRAEDAGAQEAPRPPTPYARPEMPSAPPAADEVERVPMSRLRQRIAARLRQAQATAAILTTFNEIDMSAVTELRARFKSRFAEVHGVPLGFMSFFARACISALREVPAINAQIDGTDIVYHQRVHLGVAVGTGRGLVVPVVRNADQLDFAALEREIARLAGLARDNKLSIDDLNGGTFTISNGGIYGSLLSTPILNPPQSAILGMHKIEKRPVVVDDQITIRPMMYVALSYDHRLIDGAEAVTFLVKVKERLEDPSRMLLGV
ncbi:MAG: 2-oxoglutarate dehydrogenase complex dihydrolipoyllysine-residue succinyltransferase [Candidatus Binatia bacterium]